MTAKTYNADNKWYWGERTGPRAAIDFYEQASGDKTFHNLLDHPDRQQLEGGEWEYVAHPYIRELGNYQTGADALEGLGWALRLTGTETSEYARLGASTMRVSITRRSLAERVALAEEVDKGIENLKTEIKTAGAFEKHSLRAEVKQLELKRKLLLRKA